MSDRLYRDLTERARAKKQRQRARQRARLVAARPELLDVVNRNLVSHGRCPLGCTCATCLFPPEPYRPRVARFAGALT